MREAQIQKELEEKLRHSRIFAEEAGNHAVAAGGEGFAAGAGGAGGESAPWAAGAGAAGSGAGAAGNGAGGQGAANGAAAGGQGAALRTGGKGKNGDNVGSGGKLEPKKGFQKDRKYSYQKKSDNPDVLYGRDFEYEFMDINSIAGEMGEITIRGKVIAKDSRLLGSGKTIVIYDMTDFTDTITVKMFAKDEQDVYKRQVKKKGEAAKVAMRNIRRDANDAIKKLEKSGEISEDDRDDAEEQIQKLTDKMVEKVDKAVEDKTKEIMTV